MIKIIFVPVCYTCRETWHGVRYSSWDIRWDIHGVGGVRYSTWDIRWDIRGVGGVRYSTWDIRWDIRGVRYSTWDIRWDIQPEIFGPEILGPEIFVSWDIQPEIFKGYLRYLSWDIHELRYWCSRLSVTSCSTKSWWMRVLVVCPSFSPHQRYRTCSTRQTVRAGTHSF